MAKEKEDVLELTGEVTEVCNSIMFEVTLDEDQLPGKDRTIKAHTSGRIRRNRIRVLKGDRVVVEMTPYDLTRGRIVFRHK